MPTFARVGIMPPLGTENGDGFTCSHSKFKPLARLRLESPIVETTPWTGQIFIYNLTYTDLSKEKIVTVSF